MEHLSDWRHELAADGARIDSHGSVIDFGDHAAEAHAAREQAIVTPLIDEGLIVATGADATTFLNSQLTNDIALVSSGRAQYAGYCNPKGRLLATMIAFADGGEHWLCLPDELTSSIAQRLNRYILRARVQLRVATGEFILFGVAGPQARAALMATLTAPARQAFEVIWHDTTGLINLPGNRYLIVCRRDQALATWSSLRQQIQPAGSNWWRLQTIRSGIATVTSATQEQFVPQMLALETFHGVSFEKGCYPGQEIVARTRYLGNLKRHLYYGRSEHSLASGEAIVAGHEADTVGAVTNAAENEHGGWDFLAVLQRDYVESGAELRSGGGHIVTVHARVKDMHAEAVK